jgi:hypothetical protein
MPALGALGTVIGMTAVLAGITPEQLDGSPADVTGGLAAAFDPTALALTLSLSLAACTLIVKSCERHILEEVERFGIAELAPCFPVEDGAAIHPLIQAESQAAEQLLQRTEALVTWQTELWQSALETMRGRWMETANQQQLHLTQSLTQGMSATLDQHQQQLAETRSELLGGCRTFTQELARVVDGVHQAGTRQQEQFVAQVRQVWSHMQEAMAHAQSANAEQAAQQTTRLTEAIRTWHTDLANASEAVKAQIGELRRQGEVLGALTANESELIRLQTTLQNNLQSLRAVEAFEESIHSLNAAVHLLTARALPHAA